MKKYTKYFKTIMLVALFFLALGVASMLDKHPTLSAVFIVASFTTWFSGVMAPDGEKFTAEYLRKRKNWL
jgi:hypothetical protein